jgi:hypothetical protein
MPLELTKIEADRLSPVVARAVGAPGPAKMMAARGLVPMGPNDLVTVLYQLSVDDEGKIAQAAKGTAEGLPDNILSAALSDQKLDPRVLDFFARIIVKRGPLVEQILLNRAVHDDTLVFFGKKAAERELEILAGNQERILRHPLIIEAIYFNSAARMSTVKRLLELAVRHGIELDVPQYKEIARSIMGEQQELEKLPEDQRTDAEQMKALEDDIMDEAFNEALAMGDDAVGAMEFEEKEEEEKHTRLLDRPFLEKIRLASCGKLFHRMVLIKDSNKTVSMAVIQSAGVTDQEASRYAANRSLHEDIIRYIAARKDWQKNYQVKLALVNNPKCPLASSMRLLKHLRANDIRTLSRSKNIPAALAHAAKQIVSKRR